MKLFINYKYDSFSDFVLAIINGGYRPKIYKYIPYEYATLMKQCWDANHAYKIRYKINSLIRSLYNEMDKQQEPTIQSNSSKSNLIKDKSGQKIQTSKVYTFNISAQPRNATEGYIFLNWIFLFIYFIL